MALRLALDLDVADQQGRRHGRDRDPARLGAAEAVEHRRVVAGGEDLLERGERRAHDVDAAHQLVRPAVGEDPVDHQRNHLERLRQPAGASVGEAAGDLVEEQPVRLALPLHLFDEHRLRSFGERAPACVDSTIRFALPRHRLAGPAGARPWPLDSGKPWIGERPIRNALSTPVVDQRHLLGARRPRRRTGSSR